MALEAFSKGRDFAAWLGLVPKQMSTGDRTILGKISKRGNRYLRVLFVRPDHPITGHEILGHSSKEKIRFQSFLMLMTTQPCFFASSYSAWVKVPTRVSGSPSAGP